LGLTAVSQHTIGLSVYERRLIQQQQLDKNSAG
jgi:hypothetical protein